MDETSAAILDELRRIRAALAITRAPYDQATPISVGRKTTIAREALGETEILRVPSFPMLGRVWALQVQLAEDLATGTGGPGAVPIVAEWFLRLRWTAGQTTEYVVDLDLPAGGAAFPLMCDSLRVIVVNGAAAAAPGAKTLAFQASIGEIGSRSTAIPRRTLFFKAIGPGNSVTIPIPRNAQQVTIAATQLATNLAMLLGIQFFDFAGAVVGTAYVPAGSLPGPIDLPHAAAYMLISNQGAAAADGSAIFRIAL